MSVAIPEDAELSSPCSLWGVGVGVGRAGRYDADADRMSSQAGVDASVLIQGLCNWWRMQLGTSVRLGTVDI